MTEKQAGYNDKFTEIYEPLSRLTMWWLDFMDFDRDGIAQYMHGNDSGWDNSTVFRFGTPVESPDLTAYLVYQMDVLSDIAEKLGKPGEAVKWRDTADRTLKKLIGLQSDGKEFFAVKNGETEPIKSDSLITCLPILLGRRLPENLQKGLVAKVRTFLTGYGLATEKPDSPLYDPDGYWRGPIWAPPPLIIVDGLLDLGEKELATEIAVKFCGMCKKSGMAENFDALTGEGLRDLSYTWTAAVFLILADQINRGVFN
jgi:glycogen debranching enzyme